MIDIRTDPRLAGEVSRYHTWPHLRQQSVAEHSWQVMRIMLAIYPMVPRVLLIHCMAHDAGEIGDRNYQCHGTEVELPVRSGVVPRRETHLQTCRVYRDVGMGS